MTGLGVLVRLHSLDCETIGYAHVPPPIEIGDLVATDRDVFRVHNVVTSPPNVRVGALCMVVPALFRVEAR